MTDHEPQTEPDGGASALTDGLERNAFDNHWALVRHGNPTLAADVFAEALARTAWDAALSHCISVIEAYQVPVGNSSAGELACEWTMDALREIRDTLRSNELNSPAPKAERSDA